MTKILGLDLGTNSIGLAIRDTESENENQIIDSAVVVFKKGVGEGKSGEFSLAAERRAHRSKRRLYNAKRYRKWATLKVLIDSNMCPLSIEELDLWRKYKKENGGRKYPVSPSFMQWLRMDFDNDGTLDYNNPYELRCELLESNIEKDSNRLYKIGRSFYHLVQRRGFKSSRKSGKSSAYPESDYFKKAREENPDLKAAQIWQHGLMIEAKRIRGSGVLQRIEYEKEFFAICEKQQLEKILVEKIYKAIYFVRPLRTQKGLVGKCTLEKGKSRIPISHPFYEEFRAITFINNLKWRKTGTYESYEQVPIKIRKAIFEKLFFRVSKPHFKFDEIIEEFSNKGEFEFNYKNKPNVSACPVISRMKSVLKEDWTNQFIADENLIGINWENLVIDYKVKYGKKTGKARKLNVEDLWHLLFDFIQTKDSEGELKKFLMEVVEWDEKKAEAFAEIDIQQGYGSLSKTAITKIQPYLQKGYIYSEAVSFANLKSVLGELFEANKDAAIKSVHNVISQIDTEKEKLNIVNSLIQQFYGENRRGQGSQYVLSEYDQKDVDKKLIGYFGTENWEKLSLSKQIEYTQFVSQKYLDFIRGTQPNECKASYKIGGSKPKSDYYKLPRLDEAIKQTLKEKFNATDTNLKKLYHPSDIEIYPIPDYAVDKETGEVQHFKQLGNPMPPSRGWKNPMAMRTMHELRKVINYLLQTGKVDADTKIVVEMARELNDANKRWAIQTYQRRREEQNIEFAKAIIGVAKVKYPNLNENDADNIDKVRLWWEQLENGDEIYKQVKALKEDVEKYRLWKEQECQCIYTGKMINIVDLFAGTKVDFEHTLPASASFDNSLANLTVCDSKYNRDIKVDRIPSECGNYEKEWNGYSAIKPRLEKWIVKEESLRKRIEDYTVKARKTLDIEFKTKCIRERHLLQFELDYWSKKVTTFTVKEIPSWWKNSQLVDTQIISKYARAYLKSIFKKVDVQKGSITAEFRKIYHIMGDEKKDRSKHSHHAIDAAVLTLIPGSANREAILKEYYQALERKEKYHQLPYENFHVRHIRNIENNILINHVSKDNTLADTRKKVRKRGKIVYLRDKKKKFIKDENGKRTPKVMKGDNVRGQLFEETFFGAVKVTEKDENNFPKKDGNGNYIVEKDSKGNPVVKYVVRIPISKLSIEIKDGLKVLKNDIVDTVLKARLEQQLNEGRTIEQLVSYENKEKDIKHLIRHIRVYHNEQPIEVKKHSIAFRSSHEHKQIVYAMNGENYLYLLYEGIISGKLEREYDLINLKTFVENKELFSLPASQMPAKDFFVRNKLKGQLPCVAKITVGLLVILFNENKEELKEMGVDFSKRLYKIRQLENDGRLKLDFHLEARKDEEIKAIVGDGKAEVNFDSPFPKLRLRPFKFNFILQGRDFEVKPDGEVVLKY